MTTAASAPKRTEAKFVHTEGDHPRTTVTFPSGRHLVFARTAHSEPHSEPGMYIAAAIQELQDLEKLAVACGGAVDREHRAAAQKRLSELRASLNSYQNKVARDEAALYAVPNPTPTEAIEDMEVRNYVRSLSSDQRAKFLQNVVNDPRLVLCFARDPLKSAMFHQLATAKWRERVEAEKGEAVAALQVRKDGVEWADAVMDGVDRLVIGTPIKQ